MKRKSVLMLILVGLLVAAQGLTADAQEKKKKGSGVRGKVKSCDTDKNTITVTVRVKKETKDQTLKVAAGAKIVIDGEAKTLGDIKAGTVVACRLNEDGEVTAIVAGKRKKKKD